MRNSQKLERPQRGHIFIENDDQKAVQPRLGLNISYYVPFSINILSLRDIFWTD